MPSFNDGDFERLDWQLLQNGCITMYWRRKVLEEHVTWLKEHSYQIDTFDCSKWQNESDLHEAFRAKLNFPDYYGRNLDALNDCLGDLPISDTAGRVFVFERYDCVAQRLPREAWIVLDILANNARRNLLFSRRFLILIQSDDPKLEFEPVGADSPRWNPNEWLNKERGL